MFNVIQHLETTLGSQAEHTDTLKAGSHMHLSDEIMQGQHCTGTELALHCARKHGKAE